MTNSSKPPITAWLLLLLLSLVWGSSYILMKKALLVYTSTEVATGRLLFAFLFFLPLVFKHRKAVTKQQYPSLLASALLGYLLPAFLFAIAGKHINSSLSGMLTSLSPLFTLIVGILFFNQIKQSTHLLGIAIGLIGSTLLFFSGNMLKVNIASPYTLLVLLATISYGINTNIVRKLTDIPALASSAFTFVFIGPIAFIILLGTDFFSKVINPTNWESTSYLLMLGLLGSGLAAILFNRVVQLASGLFASSVTYLIPVVAILWGVLDGELINFQHYIGITVILSGIYVVNKQ